MSMRDRASQLRRRSGPPRDPSPRDDLSGSRDSVISRPRATRSGRGSRPGPPAGRSPAVRAVGRRDLDEQPVGPLDAVDGPSPGIRRIADERPDEGPGRSPRVGAADGHLERVDPALDGPSDEERVVDQGRDRAVRQTRIRDSGLRGGLTDEVMGGADGLASATRRRGDDQGPRDDTATEERQHGGRPRARRPTSDARPPRRGLPRPGTRPRARTGSVGPSTGRSRRYVRSMKTFFVSV